jgi:hypothetical protein
MIAKRLAFALLAAVATLIYFTRPVAQKPQIVVQNAVPAAQKPPSLLAQDRTRPQPPPTGAAAPSTPPPSEAADKALRGRVTAYWRARTKSDLLTAFTFYEPQFRRQYTPQEFLLKFHRLVRFKPEFLGIDRIRYEAGGNKAVVFVRLRTRPEVLVNQELVSVTEETWLLLSGTWCKQAEALLPTF